MRGRSEGFARDLSEESGGGPDADSRQATQTSNRIRGLLTQIHPALERVLGPRLDHPAVLDLLERYPSPWRKVNRDPEAGQSSRACEVGPVGAAAISEPSGNCVSSALIGRPNRIYLWGWSAARCAMYVAEFPPTEAGDDTTSDHTQ